MIYVQTGVNNNNLTLLNTNKDLITELEEMPPEVVPHGADLEKYKHTKARYFVSGEFKQNKDGTYTRNNNNLLYRDYAVLDVEDTGLTNEELTQLFNDKLAMFNCCYYPSISHTEDNPRYRIVLELDRNANEGEYKQLVLELYNHLGVKGDITAGTFSQPQGMPIVTEENKAQYKVTAFRGGIKYAVKEVQPLQDKTKQSKAIKTSVNLGTFSDDEAIDIFKKYIENEADKLQERNNYYISVITTLCKSVLANQISYEVAIECAELLAGDNEEWKINNVKHLNSELQRANGNITYFTTAFDFKTKFKDTQNFIATVDQATGKTLKIKTDDEGKPLKTLVNYRNMIKSHYNVATNMLNHSIEIIEGAAGFKKPFDKTATELIRMKLAEKYGISVPHKDIITVVTAIGEFFKYHPIKNILEAVQWDGVERAETFLINMLGAEDTPYNREITRKTLLGAVYRIYQPGYKFDTMLILDGGQGIGKSTVIQRLAFGHYVTIQDEITRETELKISEAWIVEMEELDALKKTKSNKVKGFISSQVDTIRRPYEAKYTPVPRQLIFFGTTNDSSYLKDKTGNRRFLIMKCSRDSKFKSKIFDVDDSYLLQLWAEVRTWYLANEPLVISDETAEVMNEIVNERLLMDEIEHNVIELLEIKFPVNVEFDNENRYKLKNYVSDILDYGKSDFFEDYCKVVRNDFTTNELLFLLNISGDEKANNVQSNINARKVKKIMDNMNGWERSNKIYRNGTYKRGYRRKCTVIH